jgi:hypothetical protein
VVGSPYRILPRRDLKLRYSLSDSARVTFTIQRLSTSKGLKSPSTGAVRTKNGVGGRNTVWLSQLLGRTRLAPGRYRVLLQGTRSDGSRSQAVAVKFVVLAP